jgi:plastocyanin
MAQYSFFDVPRIAQELSERSLDRRSMMKLLGSAGIAAAGVAAVAQGTKAASGGGATALPAHFHQEESHEAPVPGPREDGTNLWKVLVGGMDMETSVEYHGFFPGEITVNAGDSIWFAYDMPMFHTVTFPGPEAAPQIFIPDPEAGEPAEGAPPKLIINPVMMTGAGGDVVDGSQLVSSVADVMRDQSVPLIYTFPTPGTYDYVCIPHQGSMQGRVIVQDAGSPLPQDQAKLDAVAAEQIAVLQAEGEFQIEQYSTPVQTVKDDGSILWEVAAGAGGPGQVRVQRFLPGELTITAGDSVKFINQSEGEPHTVTFVGEGGEAPQDLKEETFADGSLKFVSNPESFYPQGGNVWSGKGVLNSGYMGIPQLGLPMEFEVLFDTPGEYIYYCILHGDMNGGRMAAKLIVNAAG